MTSCKFSVRVAAFKPPAVCHSPKPPIPPPVVPPCPPYPATIHCHTMIILESDEMTEGDCLLHLVAYGPGYEGEYGGPIGTVRHGFSCPPDGDGDLGVSVDVGTEPVAWVHALATVENANIFDTGTQPLSAPPIYFVKFATYRLWNP